MNISFVETLSPYQFMKNMSNERLRSELAHQLLILYTSKNRKKNIETSHEDQERTEKYLRYVLKFASLDQYKKYLTEQLTLDQMVARVSETTGGIKYTVLDDIIQKLGPQVMVKNPIVNKMVTKMDKGSADIMDNLDLFKVKKKCFNSINWSPKGHTM